jgi:NAD(P)-dependent dehydrogenase (short-subunit alcohol dehydrogenase family)
LIHCAAELGLPTPLEQITGERWQRLLHVNLTAPAILTRELLPLMIDSAPAHAVFMGDSAVAEGKAYWGAYGVAKLGLRAYVNTLADETEGRGFRPYYGPGADP